MVNYNPGSCFWGDRILVKQWRPGKGVKLHIKHKREPASCIFNERIIRSEHTGHQTKNDSPLYINVPRALDIKGYGIDFAKINKNNKLKKEMEKQKQKQKKKQKLLTTERIPMAFSVAQNRKSLRLIKQKQKRNVNTTNDKEIVLNFLEELSDISFNKKTGLDMKMIVKAMNEKFNWIPVFEEDGTIKKWTIFVKHSDKSNTKHIPWFEVKKS